MESLTTYNQSIDEMKRIKKNIGSGSVSINFEKLDTETAGQLRTAITNVLVKRTADCRNVIMTNNN